MSLIGYCAHKRKQIRGKKFPTHIFSGFDVSECRYKLMLQSHRKSLKLAVIRRPYIRRGTCSLLSIYRVTNERCYTQPWTLDELPKCNLPRRVTTKTPQDKDRQGTNFKYTTIKTLALARPRGSMQQLFYSVFWICIERMIFSFRMTADSTLQRACCKIWKTNAVTAGGPLSFRCHQMAYLLGVCLLR